MPKVKKDEELKEIKKKSKESVSKAEIGVKKVKENIKKGVKKSTSNTKKREKAVKSEAKPKKENLIKKSSKTSAKKTNKKVASKNSKADKTPKKQEFLQEYYDLPYRYNETVVKILAQTPKRLFVYWEISEKDKQTYINAFGEDFFEKTYPVLLVHNEEMNYTFEVPINDFANSWYLDIQDPKTKYVVQLGRKFRNVQEAKVPQEVLNEEHINLQNDFIYITDSNELEAPNDHVLFETLKNQVTYRDVKTGKEVTKDISSMLEKLGSTYKDADIESIYKELYGEEISEELLRNPSSGGLLLTSSGAISKV